MPKDRGMNMTKIKMSEFSPLLDDQELKELDAATSKAPVFDDDSPELTEEDLAQFKRINHAKRNKQTASIRLSEKLRYSPEGSASAPHMRRPLHQISC